MYLLLFRLYPTGTVTILFVNKSDIIPQLKLGLLTYHMNAHIHVCYSPPCWHGWHEACLAFLKTEQCLLPSAFEGAAHLFPLWSVFSNGAPRANAFVKFLAFSLLHSLSHIIFNSLNIAGIFQVLCLLIFVFVSLTLMVLSLELYFPLFYIFWWRL